jgi:pheromone receptor transcription factor
MADITDQHDQTSPGDLDETVGNGNVGESRGVKRQRASAPDEDDDDDDKGGRERRKIEIKFINDKSRRHITFSKRKAGIMKKVSVACPVPTAPGVSRRCVARILPRAHITTPRPSR